ncbi:MAG: hypothetical protein IKO16_11185 [Lachnospiraceae bacterium]|nr:hypothetical protein [Lachnospiraceae bacterium]
MSMERAKRGLKRFGYIWVICGGFLVIIGVILLLGAKAATADAERAINAPTLLHGGITNLVLGLVGIDSGYRCFRAVKDSSKIKSVCTIARIFILLAVLAIVAGLVRGTLAANSLSSCIASIVVNGVLLYEANIVKKENGADA